MTEVMTLLKFIEIVAGGIIAGIIGSVTGLGGGSVLVPILTLFYGVPIIFATGASLISTIATSAGSAGTYTKKKIANVKIGVGLEVATTLGAIVGSLTVTVVYKYSLEWVLYLLFGIVILTSIVPTVNRGKYEGTKVVKPDFTSRIFQLQGKYYDQNQKKSVEYIGIRWWLGEIIMFFAGMLSGLLGIGSGALKVLGMDWAMNLPMKVTTTTSNFMIGITAATSSSIYWYNGFIQFYLAAATAIGVLIGAIIGSKILLKISNKDVRWVFFAILSYLGVEMALEGLRKGTFISLSGLDRFYIAIAISGILIVSLYVIFRIGEKNGQRQ